MRWPSPAAGRAARRDHARTITVTSVGGGSRRERLLGLPRGTFVYNQADKTGSLPGAMGAQGTAPVRRQPVRRPRERPGPSRASFPKGAPTSMAEAYKIKIGYNPVTGTQKPVTVQKDIWWWLALFALGVLLVEWYIYNRRVYI